MIIVGRQFAGKSTMAEFISSHSGGTVIELGRIARIAAQRAGKGVLEYTTEMFAGGNFSFVVDAALEIAECQPNPILVGPRTRQEIDILRRSLPRCVCLGLDASPDTRRERWRNLKYEHDIITKEADWGLRESLEEKWGTDSAIDACDIILSNWRERHHAGHCFQG